MKDMLLILKKIISVIVAILFSPLILLGLLYAWYQLKKLTTCVVVLNHENKDRKYEIVEDNVTEIPTGIVLYRIRALKDFGNVKKGDLGGWIEKESNLSQDGDCWVYDNACVFDDAMIYDNAVISGYSWVYNNARVYNNAECLGKSLVFGDARVYDYARILDYGMIYDRGRVHENAQVSGDGSVYEDGEVCGNSIISDKKEVKGKEVICDTE